MSKRILWIIISLLILTIGVLLFFNKASENDKVSQQRIDKTEKLNTVLAKSSDCEKQIEIDLRISPSKTFPISFPVSGTLEKGDVELKTGQKFKFNDLLAKINIKPAFEKLNELKADLKTSLTDALDEFQKELPAVQSKWRDFSNSISVSTRLKELPKSQSDLETTILIRNKVVKAYMIAKEQEEEIEKYFFLAKSSGEITKVIHKPGIYVKKGSTIAEYQLKGSNILFGTIERSMTELPKEVLILNNSGENIGSAKYIKRERLDENSDLVYYGFDGKLSGSIDYKIVTDIKFKCFSIPENAVNGTSVTLLKGNKKIERKVEIIRKEGGLIYILGLQDGEEIVLPE